MLALTRRIGEEIIIRDGEKIVTVIRVVQVHGDKVRLSFDAPERIEINRRELDDHRHPMSEVDHA